MRTAAGIGHQLLASSMLLTLPSFAGAQAAEETARISILAGDKLVQVVGALAAVLLLIAACAWLARRFARPVGVGGERLNVVAALAIGPRERVLLLRVGTREVLLAVTPGKISSLAVLPDEAPGGTDNPARVSQSLAEAAE